MPQADFVILPIAALPTAMQVSGTVIIFDGGSDPVFVNGVLQGTELPMYSSASTDSDDGESSGTAQCSVIDTAKIVEKWDWVQIHFAIAHEYSGGPLTAPVFFGRINSVKREIADASGGVTADLTCVGAAADILQIETTSPIFNSSYLGFGDWHLGDWTRSEMIEDLCLIHGISPRLIQSTSRKVDQKPFVQMRLADILAEIAIPEHGKFRFGPDGVFRFFTVDAESAPHFEIEENKTLLSISVTEEHEKIANQVLVVGSATDSVNVVKPLGVVKKISQQVTPAQQFVNLDIDIPRSLNDTYLTHTYDIVSPSGYALSTTAGTVNNMNPQSGWNYDLKLPKPGNPAVLLDVADDVTAEFRITYNSVYWGQAVIGYELENGTTVILFNGGGTGEILARTQLTTSLDAVKRFFFNTPNINGGAIAFEYWIEYRARTETGRSVVVKKRADSIDAQDDGQKTTLHYFVDINTSTNIQSVATGNPAIVTTAEPHWFRNGDYVRLSGSNASPAGQVNDPNGYQITYINETQFSIPVNVTGAGGAVGTVNAKHYASDTVSAEISIQGRAITVARFPLTYYAVRDQASVDDFGERALELQAASINTIEEAQQFAIAILDAAKTKVEVFEIECAGLPFLDVSQILKISTTSPNPQTFFGASRTLYVIRCSHSLDVSAEGHRYTTRLTCVPIERALLSVVRNFGLNPVKDRASAQAEFLAGFVTGRIDTVTNQQTVNPGEPDPQQYDVQILTASTDPANPGQPFVIREVTNIAAEQFVDNDTVLLIFQDADRSRPQIVGRAPQVLVDGVSMLLQITNISVHATDTTITTLTPHGLITGNEVRIYNTNSTPVINTVSSTLTVTVTGPTTFTVPFTVTAPGNSGTVVLE
jgi:hypothetical protein